MPLRPLFDLLFYGHIWIALAATALGWQSVALAGREGSPALYAFLFFATLGVYTLHRLLTLRRAGGQPDGRRYRVVRAYPLGSMAVGVLSIAMALCLGLLLGPATLAPALAALPFTFFYLIPLYPGGPRLRDLPYLKVVWVALAWALMTDLLPQLATGGWTNPAETYTRLAFTLAVALLFDVRDVELDRRQGVRTLAAIHPNWNMGLAMGLLSLCSMAATYTYPSPTDDGLFFGYTLAFFIAIRLRHEARDEDYYAVWVNGVLLLPPITLWATNAAP